MSRKLFLLSVALLIVFLGLVALPARADGNASRGDAEALLNAWNNGRRAVSLAGAQDGPFIDPFGIAVLPLPFLDGAHYCEEDHLLLMLAWFTGPSPRNEAVAVLDTISQEFILDGQPVETTRTEVKRRFNFPRGSGYGWGFNEGAIIAPGTLSPGAHTFDDVITIDGVVETVGITFFVDAAGTGVCQ